ncbi:MAG: undecaprenyl-phosphate glucose phosphotransferase [Phycisphaerales bacterium]
MLKQRHQFFVALLCLADAGMIAVSCVGAWAARRLLVEGGFEEGWLRVIREPLSLFAVPIGLAAIWVVGLYRARRDRSFGTEVRQIVRASLSTAMGVIVLLWVLGTHPMGAWGSARSVEISGLHVDGARLELAVMGGLMPGLLMVVRGSSRLGLRAIRRRGWNLRHVVVVGTGRLGRIAARTFDRNAWTGISVAYFISHQEQSPRSMCAGRPVRGGLADLERLMDHEKPDAVYLALPTNRASQVPLILRRLERYAVDVRLIPDVPPKYVPQSMAVHELDGMPILSVRECPSEHGLGGIGKRGLDILGALAGIVLFGPLMIAVGLLVRATSPGPVIFKQRRVSLGGEQFNIYKFRTMYHAEDEQGPAKWTSRNDQRITAVGRWLRRTSLDELPQLFNVLCGEMSLVGPRPERPELILKFRDDWRGYMLRQHVKAGITGWAQVNGLRGDTSLKKRLQLDLFYVRHWSLGFDLKILWLTLFRGFVHRNAH